MTIIPALLAILTAAAGWYYLFFSKAVDRLSEYEGTEISMRRQRLRRIGGVIMMLLGLGMYLGFTVADESHSPRIFVVVWLAVIALMLTMVLLALMDLRLTYRLRRQMFRATAERVAKESAVQNAGDSATRVSAADENKTGETSDRLPPQ